MEQSVPLIHYLFTRLRQLGVQSMHGVPGDYNLVALDYLSDAGLEWVGDANELNAGYAADGYARVNGLGAVLTTFGVGELSAINAIAGSYAEYVPVVHIAGSPSTASQQDGTLLHHTLGNGDFSVFADIYQRVTVAQARLHDLNTAPEEIDIVLRRCCLAARPVYIEVPTDIVTKHVRADRLKTPLDLSPPQNDSAIEQEALDTLLARLYSAKQPAILVDGCIDRHGLTKQVSDFVLRSNLPTFVAPMGKGIIDESLPNFAGVYAGNGSHDAVRDFIDRCDLILAMGTVKSDFNTTGFTYRLTPLNTVDLHTGFIDFQDKRLHLFLGSFLTRLDSVIDYDKLARVKFADDPYMAAAEAVDQLEFDADAVTHKHLWPNLSAHLKPGDILVTETGTSYLGVWETRLPSDVLCISQTLWGSIGYALPAAQGAALAAREMGRKGRVILFEGDGSAQLTAQAIGTMLRLKLDIDIFLINNDGYTIERYVHGMDASYNDVPGWRYSMLPETMGAGREGHGNAQVVQIRTKAELEAFWESHAVNSFEGGKGKGMNFVELFMPKKDAPLTLQMVCAAAAKKNAG